MSRCLHKLLVVTLPVDVDEQSPRIPQDALGHGAAIDASSRATVTGHDSLKKEAVPLRQIDPQLGKSLSQLPRRRRKQSADQSLILTRTDKVTADSTAREEAHAINEQGFTCSRFSRQDAKTVLKVDIQRLNDGYIFNV